MASIKVLIVDHCPVVRDALGRILKGTPDLQVLGEAATGGEAISLVKGLAPDVVLMDAQLPDMEGVEATRTVKETCPHVKVILTTVHASYIEAALAAGADRYLMKDCTWRELVAAIREVAGPPPLRRGANPGDPAPF